MRKEKTHRNVVVFSSFVGGGNMCQVLNDLFCVFCLASSRLTSEEQKMIQTNHRITCVKQSTVCPCMHSSGQTTTPPYPWSDLIMCVFFCNIFQYPQYIPVCRCGLCMWLLACECAAYFSLLRQTETTGEKKKKTGCKSPSHAESVWEQFRPTAYLRLFTKCRFEYTKSAQNTFLLSERVRMWCGWVKTGRKVCDRPSCWLLRKDDSKDNVKDSVVSLTFPPCLLFCVSCCLQSVCEAKSSTICIIVCERIGISGFCSTHCHTPRPREPGPRPGARPRRGALRPLLRGLGEHILAPGRWKRHLASGERPGAGARGGVGPDA